MSIKENYIKNIIKKYKEIQSISTQQNEVEKFLKKINTKSLKVIFADLVINKGENIYIPTEEEQLFDTKKYEIKV